MSDKIILPTADAVIIPLLHKLYELQPDSFQHLNLRSGRYWHPVLGFRAQAAEMIRRVSVEIGKRRLKTATGKDLLDYVASEFTAVPVVDPTFAEGTVTLGRKDASKALPGGDYPKGTRVTRAQYTALGVTVLAAQYETLADAHVDLNSAASVTVPVRATRSGPEANAPILVGVDASQYVTIEERIPNVVVTDFQAGGGSQGPDDTFVRLFARAYGRGQYGPTADASKLGALSGSGVRHPLVFDRPDVGAQQILVADASWGSSARWAGIVQRSIYDAGLVGFGCKVVAGRVRNRVISVDAIVSLRDTNYLAETTEIDVAIQTAVRSYFDDRPDWSVWNESALCSAISRAHSKVFTCSSAIVKDSSTGGALSEILLPDYTVEQFHYYLASNAMKIQYTSPS